MQIKQKDKKPKKIPCKKSEETAQNSQNCDLTVINFYIYIFLNQKKSKQKVIIFKKFIIFVTSKKNYPQSTTK